MVWGADHRKKDWYGWIKAGILKRRKGMDSKLPRPVFSAHPSNSEKAVVSQTSQLTRRSSYHSSTCLCLFLSLKYLSTTWIEFHWKVKQVWHFSRWTQRTWCSLSSSTFADCEPWIVCCIGLTRFFVCVWCYFLFFGMCCGQAKKRLQFILKQINSLKTGVRHFRGGVSPLLLFEMDLKKMYGFTAVTLLMLFFILFCCRWFCSASES